MTFTPEQIAAIAAIAARHGDVHVGDQDEDGAVFACADRETWDGGWISRDGTVEVAA